MAVSEFSACIDRLSRTRRERKRYHMSAPVTSADAGSFGDAIAAAHRAIEIEIATLQRQIEPLNAVLPQLLELIVGMRGRLIMTGIGKSGHIASKMAATFASTGTPSFFVHSTEALHGDAGMVREGDVVIAISNSGKTAEVVRFVQVLNHRNIPVVAITRDESSPLAQGAKITIRLAMETEADPLNLAPTASTTATLAVGDALAAALMTHSGFTSDDFALHHVGGSLGQALDAADLVPGSKA